MKKEIVVLDTDQKQSKNICRLLVEHQYEATPLKSLDALGGFLEKNECHALIMNMDGIAVTNKTLRELKRKQPMLNIIALSRRQFHPELEEALREYISVCLGLPVDTDELAYWLKTVFENGNTSKG